jgi:hypothetical protein
MSEIRKLDVAAVDCDICGEGQAPLYEETRTGQVVEPRADGVTNVTYASRYRVCDHCECEFAGMDESRYNSAQVRALREAHGAISFPR